MNKLNVTGGEWKVIDNGHYIDVHALDEDEGYISQVCIGVDYKESNNAYLIAQSKNMYELLGKIESSGVNILNCDDMDDEEDRYSILSKFTDDLLLINKLLAECRGEHG